MRRKPGTNRQIVYEIGTASDHVHLDFKVYYEPSETQCLVDGIPGLNVFPELDLFPKFDLDSCDSQPEAAITPETSPVEAKPTIHAGNKVQTSLIMSGPNAFTVMSVIKEVHIYEADDEA